MPCCAFAAFILSQIVLGFGTVKRVLLFRTAEVEELANNPATEWRLGAASDSAMVAAAKPRWTLRGLVLAASIELALVLGAAWGMHAHQHHHHGAASIVAAASRN